MEQKNIKTQASMTQNEMKEEKEFRKGDKVKIHGLQSKPMWNGKIGEVAGAFSRKKKRWPVEVMEDDKKCRKVLLKASNLSLVSTEDQKLQGNADEDDEKKEDDDKADKEKEFVQSMLWNNTQFKENDGQSVEHQMGSFQSLIDEMQSVRNDAKSGKLTDEQRRQKAADTALKLMSYMGLEDDDDGSDHDDK